MSTAERTRLIDEVAARMREHGYTKPLVIRYRAMDTGGVQVTIKPQEGHYWSATAQYALIEIITSAFKEDTIYPRFGTVDDFMIEFRWYR